MTAAAERRLLQTAVVIACLVPLLAGGAGMLFGPSFVGGAGGADLDSHFRYLSGLLFAIGLAFLFCVRRIEARGLLFGTLALIVFAGGLARLMSALMLGLPSAGHGFGLLMELAVVPLLALWQVRVARRCTA